MNYRYPFTPFPNGWYRIDVHGKSAFAFGMKLNLEKSKNGYLTLSRAENPEQILPVVQRNGHYFAFFDERDNKPYFEVPEVREFNDQNWQRPFSLSWKRTKVHIQEVAENAVDLSHFCTVHTYQDVPELSQFRTFGHQFNVMMHSRIKVLGFMSHITMDITYHGMGIVIANVDSSSGVTLKVLLMSTPIDQESIDIHMAVAIKKTRNPIKNCILRCAIPMQVKAEFSRDIPVWEAKIYRDRPLLCKNEANIVRIRKWAKQFYSKPLAYV